MENPSVLMLAWATSSASKSLYPTPFAIAKALANQSNLTLILPQATRDIELGYPTVCGLDTLDEQATKPQIHPPELFPFAKEFYIHKHIPLYGAPVLSEPEKSRQHLPGESITVGNFSQERELANASDQSNTFDYFQFAALPLPNQVIAYARYVNRAAYAINFDYIYAYDWVTYLAATELKVWSGKKLAAHVSSLSVEKSTPDSKGWIYEIEKRTFQEADMLIAASSQTARTLQNEYGIPDDKIYQLIDAISQPERIFKNIKKYGGVIEKSGMKDSVAA